MEVYGLGTPPPLPLFFVSVASKGFSLDVSLLSATLAGRPISVAGKGLIRAWSTALDGKVPDRVLDGLPDRIGVGWAGRTNRRQTGERIRTSARLSFDKHRRE
jgi:hypothetical protein